MTKSITDMSAAEYELALEYSLTIAVLSSSDECEHCLRYFIKRKPVLVPAILEMAAQRGEGPAEVFFNFRKGVHLRHEAVKEIAQANKTEGEAK